MDREIKKPVVDKPTWTREPYDYRNEETAGPYCGVGEAGKTAPMKEASSIDAMPREKKTIAVPRDHKG